MGVSNGVMEELSTQGNYSWTEQLSSPGILEEFTYFQDIRVEQCGFNASTIPVFTPIDQVKYVAYGIILPILVTLGVLGDILNLVVLTRPNMTGRAYVYMRGYAAASLFALLCAIPFTNRVLTAEYGRWTSYPQAVFHAHVELYFGNSCIGVGVLMLLALTVERYLSVCHPALARNVCGGKRAYITVGIIPLATFALYTPYLFIYSIRACLNNEGSMVFTKNYNSSLVDGIWFQMYKWMLEFCFKLIPTLVLVYLNIRIIRTYKAVCEKRRKMTSKVSGEQRKQYAEESRLLFLLGGTSTLFFVCMTPMIVLSVTVHWANKTSFLFQIFRATANVMEVTNFAVTFYVYCLFSKDFRETFLRTVRNVKETSVGSGSLLGSVSGIRDAIRSPQPSAPAQPTHTDMTSLPTHV